MTLFSVNQRLSSSAICAIWILLELPVRLITVVAAWRLFYSLLPGHGVFRWSPGEQLSSTSALGFLHHTPYSPASAFYEGLWISTLGVDVALLGLQGDVADEQQDVSVFLESCNRVHLLTPVIFFFETFICSSTSVLTVAVGSPFNFPPVAHLDSVCGTRPYNCCVYCPCTCEVETPGRADQLSDEVDEFVFVWCKRCFFVPAHPR